MRGGVSCPLTPTSLPTRDRGGKNQPGQNRRLVRPGIGPCAQGTGYPVGRNGKEAARQPGTIMRQPSAAEEKVRSAAAKKCKRTANVGATPDSTGRSQPVAASGGVRWGEADGKWMTGGVPAADRFRRIGQKSNRSARHWRGATSRSAVRAQKWSMGPAPAARVRREPMNKADHGTAVCSAVNQDGLFGGESPAWSGRPSAAWFEGRRQ